MRGTRGYTILEVMIVIGIIGILAGIAIPNFVSWRSKQWLLKGADEIHTLISLARMAAIRENSQVVVRIDPLNRSYSACVDNGPENGTCDAAERVLRAGVLSSTDISLTTNFTDNRLVIDGRGFPSPVASRTVTLTHPTLGTKVVAVTVTGQARVQ